MKQEKDFCFFTHVNGEKFIFRISDVMLIYEKDSRTYIQFRTGISLDVNVPLQEIANALGDSCSPAI